MPPKLVKVATTQLSRIQTLQQALKQGSLKNQQEYRGALGKLREASKGIKPGEPPSFSPKQNTSSLLTNSTLRRALYPSNSRQAEILLKNRIQNEVNKALGQSPSKTSNPNSEITAESSSRNNEIDSIAILQRKSDEAFLSYRSNQRRIEDKFNQPGMPNGSYLLDLTYNPNDINPNAYKFSISINRKDCKEFLAQNKNKHFVNFITKKYQPLIKQESIKNKILLGDIVVVPEALHQNLSGLNFNDRNVSKIIFQACNLDNSSFEGANLDYSYLAGSSVNNCSFRKSQMIGTNMSYISGGNTDFSDTIGFRTLFIGAKLGGLYYPGQAANFQNAKLVEGDFGKVELTGGQFGNANFTRSNFTAADMSYIKAAQLKARDSVVEDVVLRGGDLRNADLNNAILNNTDAFLVNFDGADMRRVQAEYLLAQFASMVRTKREEMNIRHARLDYVKTSSSLDNEIDNHKPVNNFDTENQNSSQPLDTNTLSLIPRLFRAIYNKISTLIKDSSDFIEKNLWIPLKNFVRSALIFGATLFTGIVITSVIGNAATTPLGTAVTVLSAITTVVAAAYGESLIDRYQNWRGSTKSNTGNVSARTIRKPGVEPTKSKQRTVTSSGLPTITSTRRTRANSTPLFTQKVESDGTKSEKPFTERIKPNVSKVTPPEARNLSSQPPYQSFSARFSKRAGPKEQTDFSNRVGSEKTREERSSSRVN